MRATISLLESSSLLRSISQLRPALFLLALSPAGMAQSLLFHLEGTDEGDQFGLSVAGAGDIDGDGASDWLVGSPGSDELTPRAGAVKVVSGTTGSYVHELYGALAGDNFGNVVDGLGDLDLDGRGDFVVGTYQEDSGGADAGRVQIYSGATASLLFETLGVEVYDNLGYDAAGAGDVNNDGTPDVIVSAPGVGANLANPGRVLVFSGAGGAPLYSILGENTADGFGWSVDGAGDWDNDGFADVIVGAIGAIDPDPTFPALDFNRGRAYIYSGADGSLLQNFDGDASTENLGWSVAGLGDANGDGVADVAIGSPFHQGPEFDEGRVQVFAGPSGVRLLELVGDEDGEWCGFAVGAPGDLDGDDKDDLLVGSPFGTGLQVGAGSAQGVSVDGGFVLFELKGLTAQGEFGISLDSAGDVNGDGIVDIVVGADFEEHDDLQSGAAHVYSSQDLVLQAAAATLSVSAGGSVKFDIDFGSLLANEIFLIVGTASGTSPGTPLGGGLVAPINIDVYTNALLAAPNTLPVVPSYGGLDALGKAYSFFTLPAASDPVLAGLLLHHAVLAIQLSNGAIAAASNPVPLTLLP